MADVDDLRELYIAAHARLVMVVASITGDVTEAEDCVQEAFARAVPRWRRLARYDDPEAWVRQVAINLARSRWRRAVRGAQLHRQAAQPPDVAPLSADHVALLAALKQLPDEQRDAIVLHYLVDRPITEIAARQGVAVGTVKARLSRGRRALAERLGLREETPVPDCVS
ncbi:MAG: SigE family RNA polymerase sigma factor [Mycobacteriales bacterium]